ncbi:MAG TPA: IS1634 family transposase [Methanospirillum sp.]|uniref:IS1634 family transposase n=1 Tax=Methanospirillum sp. TaxID=45200 RepID=UPI002CAA78AD|nr:IS1634 family transposase [Methanospirillum sp.]HPY60619.1 IS1634 family transposase [Methanospirillum sp.]
MEKFPQFTSQDFTSRQIGHLGLVAGMIDELGISAVIDEELPKTRDHILPHSKVVTAMLLNGLGFNERRLYFFSRFFTNLSTEQLFGPGVTPEHLNDDVLLRTLDRIYDYGTTDLFNRIVMNVMKKFQFGTHMLHADTTSFSVHGDYDNDEEDFRTIQIAYGHNKDLRWDLKQFVLSMVTNQHGIPLFAQPYSGNESDKKILLETIQKVKLNLNLEDKAYYVADSAFYTGPNLQTLGQHTFWISHPPATIDEVKTLLVADVTMVPGKEEGYSFHERLVNYAGIEQKWVLVHSEKRRAASEKNYPKNLDKRLDKARKSLKKLRSKEFACEPDAQMAARLWFDDYPYLSADKIQILSRTKKCNGKKGRPGKDDSVVTVYSVDSPIEVIPEVIEQEKTRLGRFVLATNDLDLDADSILKYYKGQQSVERGFRFLKDKSFRVAEVFLKKKSRIEALSMIMVLCLFVYAIAEWYLRSKLKETGKTVNNQLNKPIQNPTMKWIFTLFMRPAEVTVSLNSHILRFIVNLNEEVTQILEIMGQSFEKYYFVRPTREM